MGTLSEAARVEEWEIWMRENEDPTPMTRQSVRAAVDAMDDWYDANIASLNAALPAAFRTTATPGQKARMSAQVVVRRGRDGA